MSRTGVFDDHKCTPLGGPEVIIQEDNDKIPLMFESALRAGARSDPQKLAQSRGSSRAEAAAPG